MVADGSFHRLRSTEIADGNIARKVSRARARRILLFKCIPYQRVSRLAVPDLAYIGAVMKQSGKYSAWRIVTASVLLFALLLALLAPPQYLTFAAICPMLAIVFLFGMVHVPDCPWLPLQTSEDHPPQSSDLPSRFQRPPPATT
jgi:hypothetical protein